VSDNAGLLDLTPILAPERAVLLELLGGLSASDWERATECPAWNVKGIALHILGDDLSLLTRRRDASTDSLMLFAQDHSSVRSARYSGCAVSQADARRIESSLFLLMNL
jgi:hypothetical protein